MTERVDIIAELNAARREGAHDVLCTVYMQLDDEGFSDLIHNVNLLSDYNFSVEEFG